MKIKTGDNVKVLSGRDKGKKGKVVQILAPRFVVVEGVNLRKKHMRATRGQKGQTLELPAPMDASNVMVIGKEGKPTRVKYSFDGKVKKRNVDV